MKLKLTKDERALLLAHTPLDRWMSSDLVQAMLAISVVVCVVTLGIVPIGYYISGCSAQSSHEDDLLNFQTWYSLETGSCAIDDAWKCKQFSVAQKLAPHIEAKNGDDVFYGVVTEALRQVNGDLFLHISHTNADRDLAIDMINRAKHAPAEKLEYPDPPEISPTPWMALLLWSAGVLAATFGGICVPYRWIKAESHVADLARPVIGLDDDLRSSYFDLLRKEMDMRKLIIDAPYQNSAEISALRARAEELRGMLKGLRDQQTARDRAARDMKLHEISVALSEICAEAKGRLAHVRQQTDGVVTAAEVVRSV